MRSDERTRVIGGRHDVAMDVREREGPSGGAGSTKTDGDQDIAWKGEVFFSDSI